MLVFNKSRPVRVTGRSSRSDYKAASKGFLVIVVTNQPVIARGEVSLSELELIHNKMETLLAGQELT